MKKKFNVLAKVKFVVSAFVVLALLLSVSSVATPVNAAPAAARLSWGMRVSGYLDAGDSHATYEIFTQNGGSPYYYNAAMYYWLYQTGTCSYYTLANLQFHNSNGGTITSASSPFLGKGNAGWIYVSSSQLPTQVVGQLAAVGWDSQDPTGVDPNILEVLFWLAQGFCGGTGTTSFRY